MKNQPEIVRYLNNKDKTYLFYADNYEKNICVSCVRPVKNVWSKKVDYSRVPPRNRVCVGALTGRIAL